MPPLTQLCFFLSLSVRDQSLLIGVDIRGNQAVGKDFGYFLDEIRVILNCCPKYNKLLLACIVLCSDLILLFFIVEFNPVLPLAAACVSYQRGWELPKR